MDTGETFKVQRNIKVIFKKIAKIVLSVNHKINTEHFIYSF